MKKSEIRHMIREALVQNLGEADDTDPKPPKEGEDSTVSPQPDANTPAEQAHALKLKYAGWSTWEDDQGNPVAKTVGDKLVKLDAGQVQAAAGQNDPYGNDQPPVTLAPKTGRANKISGHGTNEPKPEPVKAASSTGGAGSFKGHVTKDAMEFPPLTPAELIACHKAATVLEQKHGSKEKAIAKLVMNREVMKKKFALLQGHNTNDSQKRYERLAELQHTIDKMEATIKSLAGGRVGKPGSITPPKNAQGEPVEVDVNGEKGYLDVVEGDTALVTLHSGKSIAVPAASIQQGTPTA
jgi:hypothetical protein